MKFSVLLPTRNRLELLKFAIASVMRQDYSDWEIIISDNFSEQDIKSYASSLNDERIKYYRTDSFVPVTDNWNLALEKSSGDYFIMLGDDDCLMQGYFTHLAKVIQTYEPEMIYTGAFQYVYPNVLTKKSQLHLYTYDLLKMSKDPFLLQKEQAHAMARDSLNFKALFGYNMQFALIKRSLVQSLAHKGPFFQSPYPDYYAMNVLMLCAEKILVYPKPLVTIGISPKSFGFYYFNNREKEGVQFLNSKERSSLREKLEKVVLPGSDMNTSWLLAMETIQNNYGEEISLRVNYKRYRLLQILKSYSLYFTSEERDKRSLSDLKMRLSLLERLLVSPFDIFGSFFKLSRRFSCRIFNRMSCLLGTYPIHGTRKIESNFANILEVFEQVTPTKF